jgi:hypothetical protein
MFNLLKTTTLYNCYLSMQENQNPRFSIKVALQQRGEENLEISPAETTDGVPYYKFDLNGQEIQLRENEEGKWELLWGDLEDEDVQAIGDKINKHKV